jgi:hypothetical protein
MNEQETLEWLKISFKRRVHGQTQDEALLDENYTRLVSEEIDLNTPAIQSYMMSNWWTTMFSILRQKTEDERLPLFINKLNWTELIEVNGTIHMRDDALSKAYDREKISWFQFGLLSTHHIIEDAKNHLKSFDGVFDLVNSKGETSWHVLALALKINVCGYSQKFVDMINPYCADSLLQKTPEGKTVFDILKDNIEFNKLPKDKYEVRYPDKASKDNNDLSEILNKQHLFNELQSNLADKKSTVKRKI